MVENLYKLLGYNRGKGLKRLLYHNNGVGRETLKKYYNRLNDMERKAIVAIDADKAINSEDYLVEVTSVKTLNLYSTELTMYDFSMSGTPEYNINGHDVHNCTLYGDMNGGFCPINDLYKCEVYEMARWYNSNVKNVIPENILTKAPSAELAPGQTDEASLLPYPVLDAIVKAYVEKFVGDFNGFKELYSSAIGVVDAWLRTPGAAADYNKMLSKINNNEFKRRQAAPGIKVSPVAFGIGRRLPIVKG